MFDFNFLNRCMFIQNPGKGFIEMKQFLIYIVRQNVFIPRDLVKVAQKALRIVVLIAPSDNISSRWLGQPAAYVVARSKTSKGREGWELQNSRTLGVFQLSNTARNETRFLLGLYSQSVIRG